MKRSLPRLRARFADRGLAHRAPKRPWFSRSSTQDPGADLGRMPVGLDIGALSLAEGVRAALGSASILALNEWVGSPALIMAAIGAQLTCFCDAGGPARRRLPWLLAFAVLGALTWAMFGVLRGLGPPYVLPAAAICIFLNSFARVWGLPAQAVGNVLTVVLALALDKPLDPSEARDVAGFFALGGLWAVILTMVIWRVHPDRRARVAVADCWRFLARLAEDARELVARADTLQADWEGHARAHRRAVRDSLERARIVVADLIRSRGPLSRRGSRNVLRLEAADQVFGVLIGLTDILENRRSGPVPLAGARLLRSVRPVLVVIARGILTGAIERPERIARSLARMRDAVAGAPDLSGLADALASRLGSAAGIAADEEPGATLGLRASDAFAPMATRIWTPLAANATWNSAVLRHAVRATVVGVPAVAFSLLWEGPFQHWLTITVVLTMTPYVASTWQRALERIGGTVVGALLGATLAFFPQTPLMTAVLLFPLSVIGFSVRQVSYGAYIACLTPLVVMLIEVVIPGQSPWVTAAMRTLFTVVGGVLAVASCLLLWPTWESERLGAEFKATLAAYARYADATFAALAGVGSTKDIDRARQAAGMAHNNLEASLSRALQEPNQSQEERLDATMVGDATLRRLGASLMALQYDPANRSLPNSPIYAAWRRWLPAALTALAERQLPDASEPETDGSDVLRRIATQMALLGGAVRRM